MDYMSVFDISASGMALERLRLDVAAANIANSHTSHGATGSGYRPLEVVARALQSENLFDRALRGDAGPALSGVGRIELQPSASAPRLVLDPDHPDANAEGFVAYPAVNPVEEMVTITTAVRAYEANIQALDAAKTMIERALRIGGGA